MKYSQFLNKKLNVNSILCHALYNAISHEVQMQRTAIAVFFSFYRMYAYHSEGDENFLLLN